jgi:hypothetical protein
VIEFVQKGGDILNTVQMKAMDLIERMFQAELQYMQTDGETNREMKSVFHPEIVVHEPEFLPYAGDWSGYTELGKLWSTMNKYWKSMKVENVKATIDEESLFLNCTLSLIARDSSQLLTQPFSEYLRLQNGLIVEATPFYFDTAQINEVLKFTPRGKDLS